MKRTLPLLISLALVNVLYIVGVNNEAFVKTKNKKMGRVSQKSLMSGDQLTKQSQKQTGLIPFHKIYYPREELWREFDKNNSYFHVDDSVEFGRRCGESVLTLFNVAATGGLFERKTEIFNPEHDLTLLLGLFSILQICQSGYGT